MQRQAIAKKIAPYFFDPKPKRVSAMSTPAIFASSDVEDPTEDEAVALRRERMRRKLFRDFD
jgi:hypothetical protein